MSVLLEMAMFPLDGDESKSKEVSLVIEIIKNSGYSYQLTAMGTLIETKELSQALALVQKCYDKLEELGSRRVYGAFKFDIRKEKSNRLENKIKSVEEIIGEVAK